MGTVQEIERYRRGGKYRLWTSAGGRRQSKYVVADGKKHAADLLAVWELEVRKAVRAPAKTNRVTVHQLCTDWLEQHDVKPSTRGGYEVQLTRIERSPLGGRLIHTVTHDDMAGQERAWLDGGLAASSVRQTHAVLRQAFRWAQIRGLLDQSPVALVRPPRLPQREVTPPENTVVQDLLGQARLHVDERAVVLVQLAAATGCRRGELCGLRWSDWDGAETLMVSRSVTETFGHGEEGKRGDAELIVGSTKTRSVRSIRLDPVTVEVLCAHREWVEARAVEAGVEVNPWLLGLPGGDVPWGPTRASRVWCAVRDGVPAAKTVRLHDLRHWHATALLAAGSTVAAVAQQLGHASGATTLRVYAHATQRAMAEHAQIIGDALRPK